MTVRPRNSSTPSQPPGSLPATRPSSIGSWSARCQGREHRRHLRHRLRPVRRADDGFPKVAEPATEPGLQRGLEEVYGREVGEAQLRLQGRQALLPGLRPEPARTGRLAHAEDSDQAVSDEPRMVCVCGSRIACEVRFSVETGNYQFRMTCSHRFLSRHFFTAPCTDPTDWMSSRDEAESNWLMRHVLTRP